MGISVILSVAVIVVMFGIAILIFRGATPIVPTVITLKHKTGKAKLLYEDACKNCTSLLDVKIEMTDVVNNMQKILDVIIKGGVKGVAQKTLDCLKDQITGVHKITVKCDSSKTSKKGYRPGIFSKDKHTIIVYCKSAEESKDFARTILHEMVHNCGFPDKGTAQEDKKDVTTADGVAHAIYPV